MKRKLIARLRRIEGQTRGLQQMINDDRRCTDVLQLISSIQGALGGLWTEILNDHLSRCIRESVVKKDMTMLDELIDLMRKTR